MVVKLEFINPIYCILLLYQENKPFAVWNYTADNNNQTNQTLFSITGNLLIICTQSGP